MASEQDENVVIENSGRRTRSGRPPATAAPTRTTRRTSKRQAQLSDQEEENDPISQQMMALTEEDDQERVAAEEAQYEQLDDDVEMLATTETTGGVDDKSSSFPFGAVAEQHSETSDDVKESRRNEDGVDTSLLASLVGDNANSLPSVAGNDESDINKKSDFESNVPDALQPLGGSKLNSSDDSSSHHAIAESLGDEMMDTSNATIVNTEIISEDELPPPSKPEINDAEEVSDEELPAPQRAELPADAEVISEDELPTHNNNNNNNVNELKTRVKRKAGKNVHVPQSARDDDEQSHNETSTKLKSTEQYNPGSPTSESNDAQPMEKRARVDEDVEHNDKDKEKDPQKKEKERDKDKEKEKDKDKEKDKEKERKKLPDLDKYWRVVKDDASDFTGWTYLLQYVDSESDAEAAREAYDTFLSHYPYCYGYWRKYADYEKRKGIKANCYKVFERGLEAIPLSVDLWIHYLMHIKSHHSDEEQFIRSQYERAVQACGLEFRSDKLWDAYIRWENESKRYQRVVQIYDRLLTIPTQGYNGHFDNFQDVINQHAITATIGNEELLRLRKDWHDRQLTKSSKSSSRSRRDSGSSKEAKGEREKERDRDEKQKETAADGSKEPKEASETAVEESTTDLTLSESSATSKPAPIDFSDLSTLNEEEITSIKDKVISARRKLHKLTVGAVTARWSFEEGIKRPYFHVKPLERAQLKNWKDYLDFEIEKGDRERILVLFERCLIACALYDEFWLKMLRYLESLGSIEHSQNTVDITRGVYRRACRIHHPEKPSLHLMWAAFEECQLNFDGAAEVLERIEQRCPNVLQISYRRINVERRRGALDKCRELYKHYIEGTKNKAIAGSLAIKYARFLNKLCHDLDAGLEVLQQALERDPANTRVALQMIDLCLQRPQVVEPEIVQIMDKFMARADIEPDQKVLFAQRKVEFLEDFGSTAKGLQDAQRALQLTLSKANEMQKKSDTSPSRKNSTGGKDGGSATGGGSSAPLAAYNNGGSAAAANANYNYNSMNSGAYYAQQQNSGAYPPQQQQQQQQSYDSYYSQWGGGGGYGSGGAGTGASYNYGQWSGYVNYY
ncbi:pre-mRNA-processing factor 39 isoform X2 [Drosophila grimshawi]|uniref:Pre-mRNA-processing factor 39 n=1 Tax=Drosophila grimshawi TaxID=7222 RepID=B4JSG9_DROGR|nr:pre-mRNA-processing factor 39 isoform X2 [Drosophila grimshawi]EDV94709.1 GH22424 [Drosophila grimshawi]